MSSRNLRGATGIRRRTHLAALRAFRRLPASVRRSLIRAGTPDFTVGAVVAICHGNDMLFLRQPHREGWSLPGGLLDRGEDARHAAVREVWEETGLRIDAGLPFTAHVNAAARRVDVLFRVQTQARPVVEVGSEALDFAWMAPRDLPSMDLATLEILAILTRAAAPDGREGHVLAGADGDS